MKTIDPYILYNALPPDALQLAFKLQTAKAICEQVVTPNILVINKALGQENDPMYISYMLEYLISFEK